MCIVCESKDPENEFKNKRVLEIKCLNIRKLPKLANLEELYCIDCTSLETIRNFPKLKIIFCGGCTKLYNIQNLPVLKYLNCSNCTNLQEINVPSLYSLNAVNCVNLQTVPENLGSLNCTRCVRLREISGQNLKHLFCEDCINLRSLPDLPNLTNINLKGTIIDYFGYIPLLEGTDPYDSARTRQRQMIINALDMHMPKVQSEIVGDYSFRRRKRSR